MIISLSDLIAASHSTKTDRRRFIGDSDARMIKSADESAPIRLWREKRGDVEPEDLSKNTVPSSSRRRRRT